MVYFNLKMEIWRPPKILVPVMGESFWLSDPDKDTQSDYYRLTAATFAWLVGLVKQSKEKYLSGDLSKERYKSTVRKFKEIQEIASKELGGDLCRSAFAHGCRGEFKYPKKPERATIPNTNKIEYGDGGVFWLNKPRIRKRSLLESSFYPPHVIDCGREEKLKYLNENCSSLPKQNEMALRSLLGVRHDARTTQTHERQKGRSH